MKIIQLVGTIVPGSGCRKIVLAMKLTFFFTCILCLQLSANVHSQTRVTLRLQKVTLGHVFLEIEKKTEYRFLFNDNLLQDEARVTVDVKNEPVGDVLAKLLANTKLDFKVVNDNLIVIVSKGKVVTWVKINGKVVNAKNQPVVGATVQEKGTRNGVNTNDQGEFSIPVDNNNAVLVISSVGYTTLEYPLDGKTDVTISLSEDFSKMNEVVVVGYGTARRKEVTGAVTSVKVEGSALSLMPNLNALEALRGNVAGLNLGSVNQAGEQPSVLVRGRRSISGSNDPLILLDGVIYLGSISDINPNDIASFDILKDAVSAATYGSRSANGIIAITTKRGKSGKPVINFKSEASFQRWQNRPEMMKGEEWIETVNARNKYAPGSTNWLQAGELANYQAGKETDWLDLVTQTGIIQDYTVSVSGAAQNINYYLSGSYNDNKGIIVGDKFNRISALGKINTKITSWFELGADAAWSKRDYSGNHANVLSAQIMSPYGVLYRDSLGNLEKYPYTQSLANPLWGVNDGTINNMDIYTTFRLNTFAIVTIPWIKGLSYRVNLLNNQERREQGSFTYERYYIREGAGIAGRYDPASVQSLLSNANGNLLHRVTRSYVFDNILTYEKAIRRHRIVVTAVATRDHLKYEQVNSTGSNFTANGNTALGIYGLSKATVQRVNLENSERSNIGYLARLNYSFNDKYYVTASWRRDGASVFGEDKSWANFSAVGAAWRISGEPFLQNFAALSNLKLKFSWGQNGNQGLSPYATLSQVQNAAAGNARYEFSNAQGTVQYGLVQTTLGNSSLGWEKTAATNFGFESGWLGNRLFVDLDIYFSKTTDQIFLRTIPIMTGFKEQLSSLGQVNNTGVELTVRSVNLQRKDLSWNSELTFWKNNNKLKHLYQEDKNNDGREDDDIANNFFIGRSLGAIYGYQQDGIVQTKDNDYITMTGAAPGAPKYIDLTGDGKIDSDDRTILGFSVENFRLNLSNTVRYKNFDCYLMVSGIFGGNNKYLKSNLFAYMTAGTGRFNDNTISKPYWTPDNSSNKYPSAYFSGDSRFLGLQSRSYVRIQDLSIAYTFNGAWLKQNHLNGVRIFIAGRNLATFTKWVGGDPETGSSLQVNNDDNIILPVATSYSIGANVSF
jgi:TonB-dependent starch-binding outer membrane protein SusC